MRRDPIFYKLFQQSPELLFDLIGDRPDNAAEYRFDSVAVKEPKFEIDGVFLPPETEPGVIYFCEVQFQPDQQLYERLFSESLLYFYRNCARFCDWQTVVIYPSRRVEQTKQYPHRSLLNGEQVHRIYLDELGAIRDLPIAVASVVLTIVEAPQAPAEARYLLSRTQEAELTPQAKRGIINVVTAIMMYKFSTLSQTEVRTMLVLNLFEEPRAIREAKDEGRHEAIASTVTRQLTRRLGQELSEKMRSRITSLPLLVLENLSEALLDFNTLSDLENWLVQNAH